jgi:peptide deformylase
MGYDSPSGLMSLVGCLSQKGETMDIVTDKLVLRQVSVATTAAECKEWRVFEILDELCKSSSTPAAGMAAIQAGMALRALVMYHKGETIKMINPVIKELIMPFIWSGEGCLSCPGESYNTDRYKQCTVTWIDPDEDKPRTAVFYDALAVIVQHEIDHLNGILMSARIHMANKVGRNDPCPECEKQGKLLKWKKCSDHNKEAIHG